MSSCLTQTDLADLLRGTATNKALAVAEEHLTCCKTCQRALETLAGSIENVREMATSARIEKVEPALEQIVTKALSGQDPPSSTANDGKYFISLLAPSDRPGALGKFGDYDVLEVLGSGGMGIVLKAIERSLDRMVAIKLLAPALAVDEQARQRFLREARAAAAIRHDNIISIFAIGEVKEIPYIAMEFIEGETLAQRFAHGPLGIDELLRIARETAAGLAAAHRRGILHRDIKPGNILIERATGRAHISDFGLARAADDSGLTRSGFIAGTPEYLSPERAAGESEDVRSDIFSFGCLLYAACISKSPFAASSTLAVLRKVADLNPPPLSEVSKDVPRWFSEIVARMMAKTPADRFATAEDCLAAIESRNAAPIETSKTSQKSAGKKPVVAFAVAAAIFAILASIIVWKPQMVVGDNFIVLDSAGNERAFATIASALGAAPSNGVIELRWSGPLEIPAIQTRGLVVIRAGPNARPVWMCNDSTTAGLGVRAPLTLEGIEFRWKPGTASAGDNPPPVFFHVINSSLTLNRCRFQAEPSKGGKDHFAGVLLEGQSEFVARDSEFYFNAGAATLVDKPGNQNTSLTISNCVIQAGKALTFGQRSSTHLDLSLEQSSLQGGEFLDLESSASGRLNISALRNLFHFGILLRDGRPASALPLRESMRWKEFENLYSIRNKFLASDRLPDGGPGRLSHWPILADSATKSRDVEARFDANASGRDSFRIVEIGSVFDDGSKLSRDQWTRYGANLDAIGPGW